MKVSKLIKTERENERALREIEKLMSKPKLTKAEDEYLELLFVLVENFERKAYPCRSQRHKKWLNILWKTAAIPVKIWQNSLVRNRA